ncbi:hypothetical protein BC827DRAFT_1271590 [Russula dissimulans]|nr:hypothetical protein BC827DRAFT_1271590 [Russula dissimulans]
MPHGPGLQNMIGAMLAGAMFSAAYVVRLGQFPHLIDSRSLSGVLAVQIFFYLRRYPGDHRLYKFMVAWFWIIDTIQTSSVAVAAWIYLIRHYGDLGTVEKLLPPLCVATLCTALTAACVNILQAIRIYELNHHSLGTLVPHVILSVTRLVFSATITAKFLITGSLVTYSEHYKPLLHTNFALAAVADTYIPEVNLYSTKRILDALVIVTINNGALTFILSMATLITVGLGLRLKSRTCFTHNQWLTMQRNIIFVAVHLMTGKCYSNSQMTTFNVRRWIHRRSNADIVVSDSHFHMDTRAMAGRGALPGRHRASGNVTFTAVIDPSLSKDESTVSPSSPTATDEVIRYQLID